MNNNNPRLSKRKQVQLLVVLTILAWATQTLMHQWGFGQESLHRGLIFPRCRPRVMKSSFPMRRIQRRRERWSFGRKRPSAVLMSN